jgi:hypothetical protein
MTVTLKVCREYDCIISSGIFELNSARCQLPKCRCLTAELRGTRAYLSHHHRLLGVFKSVAYFLSQFGPPAALRLQTEVFLWTSRPRDAKSAEIAGGVVPEEVQHSFSWLRSLSGHAPSRFHCFLRSRKTTMKATQTGLVLAGAFSRERR